MRYTGFHRAMRTVFQESRRTWLVHFGTEIDAGWLDAIRERYRSQGQAPPSYTAMVVKAITMGIREVSETYPQVNAMICGVGPFRWLHAFDQISAGIAISRDENNQDAVVVGVIEDPEHMSLTEVTRQLDDFAHKPIDEVPRLRDCMKLYRAPTLLQKLILAVGRSVPKARLRYRGTFTVTTVGKFGVDWQLSLPGGGSSLQFGFGAVRERPVVRDGKVVAGKTFNLTACFDRLQMNGRPGALLMERIRQTLQSNQLDEAFATVPLTVQGQIDVVAATGGVPVKTRVAV